MTHPAFDDTLVSSPCQAQGQSVAGWLADAVGGEAKDYGLELAEKAY